MERSFMKPNIQLFAEPAPPTPPTPPTPPVPPAPPVPPKADPAPLNFDDMLKTNGDFSSWLDKHTGTAVNTAIKNAQEKWTKLHDDKLSEADKLKNMTADEKAVYFEKKYEDATAAQQRKDNARALEKETSKMFGENKIPADLLPLIDFDNATAEQVNERVKLLSGYEIYPKGTFETRLTEALNEKLKQPSPETHHDSNAVTQADFDKMSYQDQVKFKTENPELYKKFVK